jgi:hypothetical protein
MTILARLNGTSGRMVIGMDPHKRSATIEVMTGEGVIVGADRFGTDRDGYRAMLQYAKRCPVIDDEQLAVLRILVDRRRSLGEDHTRMISQLHRLLLELIPGGAKKDLSAATGQGSAGQGPPAGRGGQGPPPGRRRTHRRPGTDLPAEEGRRQDLQRGHAMSQTQTVRHRLPAHDRRRDHEPGDGPGRTPGRGGGRRLFGRTRTRWSSASSSAGAGPRLSRSQR